jgi:hypothetical protein
MNTSRLLNGCSFGLRRGAFGALVVCLLVGSVGDGSLRRAAPAPAETAAAPSEIPPAPAVSQQVGPDEVPKGLSAAEWASISGQIQQHAYQAVPVETGYRADNPSQQWQTRFDGGGFVLRPQAGGWEWGLRLMGQAGPPALSAQGNRVEYVWNSSLTEWFVNDERGLEHGFVLRQRPAVAGSALQLTLQVTGGLHPSVEADRRGVSFLDGQGAAVLRYAGLQVNDARGQALSAWLAAAGDQLQVVVEDRGAEYPLSIDPLVQQAYLKASNTNAGDAFGYAVAISGDTLVVGAPGEASNATGVNGNQGDNSAPYAGAAYLFTRSGAAWSQQAYLKASNTNAGDNFGYAVAISGDTLVVGAPDEASSATGVNGNESNNSATDAGAAYVFTRSGSTWSQQAYLKASNTEANDYFGYAVALSGDRLVVGAYGEDSNSSGVNGNQTDNSAGQAGAVYVFTRSGSIWSQQAYLKASNTDNYDLFGWSVALSGDTLVVVAPYEDSNTTGVNGNQSDNSASAAGAAYVFLIPKEVYLPMIARQP